jgi:hypothetical protein
MSKKEKRGFKRFFLFPFFSLLFANNECCPMQAGTLSNENIQID